MIAIVFLAQAEGDLLRLYAEAEEFAAGRGDALSAELEKLLVLLRRLPRIGRVIGWPYRRVKLSRFPLSCIYTVEGNRLLIHAIVSNHEPLEVLLRRLQQGR